MHSRVYKILSMALSFSLAVTPVSVYAANVESASEMRFAEASAESSDEELAEESEAFVGFTDDSAAGMTEDEAGDSDLSESSDEQASEESEEEMDESPAEEDALLEEESSENSSEAELPEDAVISDKENETGAETAENSFENSVISAETADESEKSEETEAEDGNNAIPLEETAEDAVEAAVSEEGAGDDAEQWAGNGTITIQNMKPSAGNPVIVVGGSVKLICATAHHWESSEAAIASVSYQGGVLRGIKKGTASINALDAQGNVISTLEIQVVAKLSTFKLNTTSLELAAEDSESNIAKYATLTPTMKPDASANLVKGGMCFVSSDETVATVDERGNVTAGEPGTAQITCYAGGMSLTCDVVVILPMESISLYVQGNEKFDESKRLDLEAGEKELLRVAFTPEDTTDYKTVTWSTSDKKVATVSSDGIVEALKKGSCTIKATWTSEDKKRTCEAKASVIVTTPLEEIKILNSKSQQVSLVYLNIDANGKATTETLKVKLLPSDYSGTSTVTWGSSNEEVATVSPNGTVTPVKKGYATITATCQDVESYCVVKVTRNLEAIKLEPTNISLAVGQSMNLNDYVSSSPEDCSDAWILDWKTANQNIVSVEDGIITGLKAGGPVKITVSCGSISNYFSVTVKRVAIGGLIINSTTFELQKGGAAKEITVTAAPGASISYETDLDNMVTVEKKDEAFDVYTVTPAQNGVAGTVKITFTASYEVQKYNGNNTKKTKSVKCIVKIVDPVRKVQIQDKRGDELSQLEMLYGETFPLRATFIPEGATDAGKVTWKSSKTSVATVDKYGVVKAKGDGDCQITATIGGKTSSLSLTVKRPLTDLKMSASKIDLKKDATKTLKVTCTPSSSSSAKMMDWSSSDNDVATVSGGVVRAVGGGTCIITATSQDYPELSASCVVNVSVPLSKITLNPDNKSKVMYVQDTMTVSMEYEPIDTTYTIEDTKTLPVWSSGNTSILQVEDNGDGTCTVTALKKGQTTVKCKYQKKTASVTIKVNDY